MRCTGTFAGESWTRDRRLHLTFEVNESDQALEAMEGLAGKLTIEVKRFREKRSISANDYFWVLCDGIAKVLRTNKDHVYLLMLRDAGKFVDVEVAPEDVEVLKRAYRYVEVLGIDEMAKVRCYIGSSSYNTEEMSRLIDATVEEAKGLGVETLTPDEIAAMTAAWKGSGYGY